MPIRVTMSIVTLLAALVAVEGQTKRSSKGRKAPVIREAVTVKGNLPPSEPPIRETDVDIWRILRFPEHKLTIELPARANDDTTMAEPDADGLWSVASDTEKATYRIVIRKLAGMLDSKAAAEVLDESISSAYGQVRPGAESPKIRELTYRGRPGREITTREKGKVQIFRVFIVEEKMYALFVSVNRGDQWPAIEVWANKFFDSFRVEVPIDGEA